MEGGFALGSFSTLHGSVAALSSRLSHGVRQAAPSSSRFWIMPNQSPLIPSVLFDRKRAQRQCVMMKADMTESPSAASAAPLLPESPSGLFLAELAHSHPHLVTAAAEQQLETLAEARETEKPSATGTELVLYKRIAEVRAQERQKSLEDIMYALISQKFAEAGICFVPQMSLCPKNQRVDTWPDQEGELESVHSEEAFELIREHLSVVLGGKGASDSIDHNAVAQISKLRMGRVYAASAVYGYFLRRVDKRFQLEKTMNVLPPGLVEIEQINIQDLESEHQHIFDSQDVVPAVMALVPWIPTNQVTNRPWTDQRGARTRRLRAYVKSMDAETLQRYATVRSKESVSVIERHTEALFGKPEIQVAEEGAVAIVKDEAIMLGFSGLRRLVLEAVAFGSFLWDVETYVDTHYDIVSH